MAEKTTIKVRATRLGQFGGKWHQPGAEFELDTAKLKKHDQKSGQPILPSWVEELVAEKPARAAKAPATKPEAPKGDAPKGDGKGEDKK